MSGGNDDGIEREPDATESLNWGSSLILKDNRLHNDISPIRVP